MGIARPWARKMERKRRNELKAQRSGTRQKVPKSDLTCEDVVEL